jgi:hypothetical protein
VAVGFVLIPVLFGYNIVYLEDKYTKKIWKISFGLRSRLSRDFIYYVHNNGSSASSN